MQRVEVGQATALKPGWLVRVCPFERTWYQACPVSRSTRFEPSGGPNADPTATQASGVSHETPFNWPPPAMAGCPVGMTSFPTIERLSGTWTVLDSTMEPTAAHPFVAQNTP